MAASLIGLALHAIALQVGSLTLVQPLVVTGLVFSFVFRDALDRRFPDRRTITWGLLTAAGLALFLVAEGSSSGSEVPDERGAVLLIAAGLAVSGLAYLASVRVPRHVGLFLGLCAGIVFGLIAGVLKATTSVWTQGQLLTTWPVYTLIPLGAVGFLLNQRAYHKAPLQDSLPALNMTNPLVALAFGVAVYHERPSGDPLAIVFEVMGLLGVLAGIFFLARTEGTPAGAPAASIGR